MRAPTRVLMADIAAALNVRPELVRQWLARGRLPEPSGRVGQSPWWAPEVIEPWMRQWEIDHEPDVGSGSEEDW